MRRMNELYLHFGLKCYCTKSALIVRLIDNHYHGNPTENPGDPTAREENTHIE